MMGYIKHHSIIVTSWNAELLSIAHQRAKRIFSVCVSKIVEGIINGQVSFFVAPDGSKEGWMESDEFDKKREIFKTYLRSQAYEDGSSSLCWVEVVLGLDDRNFYVSDHQYSTANPPETPEEMKK